MTELLMSSPIDPVVLWMLLVCGVACITDVLSRRIPNGLIVIGLLGSVLIQYLVWDLFGVKGAFLGIAAAFVVTLPLLLFKAIAAGDSKLMLVVGAAIGSVDMLLVLLLSIVFSGAIALAMVLYTRRVGLFRDNLSIAFLSAASGDVNGMREVSTQTSYPVPFACAVLMAGLVWLFWLY